jgi:hypothetical protein
MCPRKHLTIRDLWPRSSLIFKSPNPHMFPRYFALATGLLLLAARLVDAQEDAQDRTQSFFDNNKSADVINPDRAITDKGRPRPSPPPVQESALPPLTGVSKANAKEISKLRSQKEASVQKEVIKQRTSAEKAGIKAMFDKTKAIKKAEKDWENTQAGRKLKLLERSATTGSTLPALTR